MQLSVYVFGNGKLFVEYFNAIATLIGTTGFSSLIRLSILFGGFSAIFRYVLGRDLMAFVRWFGVFYFTFYILLVPKVTLMVEDRTDLGQSNAIDNVPLGVGVLAHFTSTLGVGLTALMESIFHMPNYLPYNETGLVMGSRIVVASNQFQITNAEFNESLQSFIQQCVFYDLFLRKYSFKTLLDSTDLWQLFQSTASPARAFLYQGKVFTCRQGVNQLKNEWQTTLDEAQTLYGSRIFPNQATAKAQLLKYLPASYQLLLNGSHSASSIMQQTMLANALSQGIGHMATTTNAPAALQNYIESKSFLQQRANYQSIGEQAAYWLPLIKNTLEMVLYAAFIFVVLLAFLPSGLSIFKQYAMSLFWIQSWAPFYAIINFAVSYYAEAKSVSVSQAGGVTLHNLDALSTINTDMTALAGYLTLSVPFLAMGLVKGMTASLTQAVQYAGGMVQSIAGANASEAASGNISMGNTSIDTHHANNMSNNHWDTMGRFNAGGMSATLSGGATQTLTASGKPILNTSGAISQLGTSINFANTMRDSYTEQADKAITASENDAKTLQDASSTQLRSLQDLANFQAHQESSGNSTSTSQSSSFTDAMNTIHRETARFAKDYGLSYDDASRMISSQYGYVSANGSVDSRHSLAGKGISALTGMSGSASIGAGGRLEHSHSDGSSTRDSYAAARDVASDNSFNHAIDTATREVQEGHFRTHQEEGHRLSQNAASSYETARRASHDRGMHLQEAQSYRQMAAKTEENAQSINSNYSQAFYEWLMKQPGTDGKGNLGEKNVLSMLANGSDPGMLEIYAKRFVQEQGNRSIHSHTASMPQSFGDVKHHYEDKSLAYGGEKEISQQYASNTQSVLNDAQRHQLNLEHSIIDHSEKHKANAQHQLAEKTLQGHKNTLAEKGNLMQQSINEHLKKEGIQSDVTLLPINKEEK
ncbi:MAG: hypothetical protein LEGION0398_MBIBDBAK_00165 [Legionellaceae bacterium]